MDENPKDFNKLETFNNSAQQWVTEDELPLSCPRPAISMWDAHPRVYLPIEQTGEAACPYCGAHYVLKD